MNSRPSRFNPYLLLGLATGLGLLLVAGCKSPEQKRMESVLYTELQLHESLLFVAPGNTNVVLARIAGIDIPMKQSPFLTEVHLDEAELVPATGGYALRLKFDKHGQLVLDGASVENRGRQVGILVRYGIRKDKTKPIKVQWIGAPKVTGRITDGMFQFTPAATPEELEDIMTGLRNAVIENHRAWVF